MLEVAILIATFAAGLFAGTRTATFWYRRELERVTQSRNEWQRVATDHQIAQLVRKYDEAHRAGAYPFDFVIPWTGPVPAPTEPAAVIHLEGPVYPDEKGEHGES